MGNWLRDDIFRAHACWHLLQVTLCRVLAEVTQRMGGHLRFPSQKQTTKSYGRNIIFLFSITSHAVNNYFSYAEDVLSVCFFIFVFLFVSVSLQIMAGWLQSVATHVCITDTRLSEKVRRSRATMAKQVPLKELDPLLLLLLLLWWLLFCRCQGFFFFFFFFFCGNLS